MENQYHDNLLQTNDASIEIVSESGDSHDKYSEWSIFSSGRSSEARSEMSSIDFQTLSIYSKMTSIVHHDGRQFIERRDLDDGGLPYSAMFYLNGEVWKVSGEDCLLMSPRRYIAKVTVEDTVDLDGAVGFEEALRTLLKHLKVVKVLMDEELEEFNKTESALAMDLAKLVDESGENIDRKQDWVLLRMLLKEHGNSLNMGFKHDLRNCSRLSSELMSSLENYCTKALTLIQRNEFFDHGSSLSDEFIYDAIQKAFDRHRAQLAAICPSFLKDKLQELSDDHILYVTLDDMNLFTDLRKLDEARFEAAWPMIFSKFLTSVQEINDEPLTDRNPLSNRIFLYICKSMHEVAKQLDTRVKTGSAIIFSEALGWEVISLKDELDTSYSQCLRQQLQMFAKLANHFEPGGPFRTSRFPYEFEVFQGVDSIPEPVRIWLCLLDNCMKDLVKADFDKMQMLSCFFKSYVSFVASEDIHFETLECLRTITHDALRSLADMTDSLSKEYSKLISYCLDRFPSDQFENECDEIETTLQKIFCKVMEMKVSSDELSEFNDVFKQLLNDLNDLQLTWFIRLTSSDERSRLLESQIIAPVDCIWKDTDFECFQVVDMKCFMEMFDLLYNSEQMPKHYQLKVILVMLQNLEKLTIGLTGKECPSDKDLLDAMIAMINSIKCSLVLLSEQPDHYCFEDFLLRMSKPCYQAKVPNLPLIGSIDSGETLDSLLDRFEGSIPKELLKNTLKIFVTQYNQHLMDYARSRKKTVEKIVSDVKSKIGPKLVTNWTEEFKQNELPVVLAGLSAIWSITVSKFDSSLEQMPKPSHLQICSILSIFGDQTIHNKDNRHQLPLLQLSTQEGKEFVLGLTASMLALYGHKVEIVCFNSHLTKINSLDWIRVFKRFSILSNISFVSWQQLAWKRSKGFCEEYTAYLKKCCGFETNSNNDKEEMSTLIIEDIDIILKEDYIFGSIEQCVELTIPGIEEVQRKKLFGQNEPVFKIKILQYIEQSDDPNIGKLRTFLNRSHSYKILDEVSLEEIEITNKTLFLERLEAMKLCCNVHNQYGYISFGDFLFTYEHLLKSFPLAISFTSAPLDVSDKIMSYVINQYGIYHTISEPNMLQTASTKFDPKMNFLYASSKDDWVEAIIVAIKAAVDRNCLVLVFFEIQEHMEQLQQTQHLQQLGVTVIKTASNEDYEISVLMVCDGHFTKDRQVHVIQTFFSEDGREEDLIRRQAERSHRGGSYEFIIEWIPFPINTRIKEITYAWLVKKRTYFSKHTIKQCEGFSLLNKFNVIEKLLKLTTK